MSLPLTVFFGLFRRRVRKFTRAPPRCCSCQGFGHTTVHCVTKPVKCSLCSSTDDWRSCLPGTPPKCANCTEAHCTTTPNCPNLLEAIKRAREFVLRPRSRSLQNPGLTRPDHKSITSPQRVQQQHDFPTFLPPREVTEFLTFADVVNAVNPAPYGDPLKPSFSAIKARQETERRTYYDGRHLTSASSCMTSRR